MKAKARRIGFSPIGMVYAAGELGWAVLVRRIGGLEGITLCGSSQQDSVHVFSLSLTSWNLEGPMQPRAC
jgi:hypothetical protein